MSGQLFMPGGAGRGRSAALTRSVKKTAAVLTMLSALWIAAVATGTLGTDDTDHRLTMAHVWFTHAPEVPPGLAPPLSRKDTQHGIVGRDGRRVIFYDPGQSILMAPIDWIGTQVASSSSNPDKKGIRIWTLNWLLFQPLNVALVLVCFWTLRLLGFGLRLAALSSLLWLIATTVLPYAQIPWQNNQVLLFSLLSIALLLFARRSGSAMILLASGAAAGMTVLMRASAVIHLFTAMLFLLLVLREQRLPFQMACRKIALWAAGAAPLLVGGRIFDYLRYGSFFATGQSTWLSHINTDPLYQGLPLMPQGYPFVNPASEGILGALFSPAKSLFIYDPLLLPCLIVGALAWKGLNPYVRGMAIVAGVNLVLHLILTSKLDFWHGDMAWGARYHVTSVQLLIVPLVPVFIQRAIGRHGVRSMILWTIVITSITVQIISVTMPSGVEIAAEDFREPVICLKDEWNSKLDFRLAARVFDLFCYESGSALASCPEQVARRVEMAHPECREMLEQFRRDNRLAFFPFNADHRIFGYRKELTLWWLMVAAALIGTSAWCFRLASEIRGATENPTNCGRAN